MAMIAIVMMVIGLQMPDSPVLLSAGMITLLVSGILNPDIKKNIHIFFSDKTLIALTLVFFIFLFSAINSTNMDYLSERLRIKLPFLAMPFAFVALRGWSPKWFHFILYVFFITIVILCGYEFAQYMSDYSAINKLYRTSYVIDTPGSHVRFSLMIAFAIFVGGFLTQRQFLINYKILYVLNIVLSVFLIAFLHILAVRSGIIAFYIGLFYLVLYSFFRYKNYKIGAVLLASLIILPIITIKVFPTWQGKIDYTRYSLSLFTKQHQVNHLSDGARIESEIVGYRLFRAHWLTGTGIGNLQDEMNKLYAKDFPDVLPQYRFIPHNEFLVFAAGCGIFGALAFAAILIFILVYKKSWKHWLFMVFNIIILSSFFTEPTIEEQVGTAFYVIFFLIIYFLIQYSYNDQPVGSNHNF
jgi:O-antigen ligase